MSFSFHYGTRHNSPPRPGAVAGACPCSGGLIVLFPRRQAFKGGHAVRDEMERLTFRREDRLLRAAIDRRVVQRSDLQNHRSQAGPPRHHVCTACRAEFPRYGVSLVGPRVALRRAFRVGESFCWHEHEQIRCPAREILARAAVALRSQDWLALRNVPHRPAIAPAFEPHGTSPVSPTDMWPLMHTEWRMRLKAKSPGHSQRRTRELYPRATSPNLRAR